jgi:hypothetical protein
MSCAKGRQERAKHQIPSSKFRRSPELRAPILRISKIKPLTKMCNKCNMCIMQHIKLTLSDSAFNKALELAGSHAIHVEAYIAGEVEDLLDKKSSKPSNSRVNLTLATSGSAPSAGFIPEFPAGLQQILDVCKHIYRHGSPPKDGRQARREFQDAVKIVAKKTPDSRQPGKIGVDETSIRDKFSNRRLGQLAGVKIDTTIILGMLCEPERMRDLLCLAFKPFANEIRDNFARWLPNKFGAN